MHFQSSIFMDLGVIFNDFWHAFRVPEGIDFFDDFLMDFWGGPRILIIRDLEAKVMIWGPYQELNQKDRSYRIEATG